MGKKNILVKQVCNRRQYFPVMTQGNELVTLVATDSLTRTMRVFPYG